MYCFAPCSLAGAHLPPCYSTPLSWQPASPSYLADSFYSAAPISARTCQLWRIIRPLLAVVPLLFDSKQTQDGQNALNCQSVIAASHGGRRSNCSKTRTFDWPQPFLNIPLNLCIGFLPWVAALVLLGTGCISMRSGEVRRRYRPACPCAEMSSTQPLTLPPPT